MQFPRPKLLDYPSRLLAREKVTLLRSALLSSRRTIPTFAAPDDVPAPAPPTKPFRRRCLIEKVAGQPNESTLAINRPRSLFVSTGRLFIRRLLRDLT